MLEISAGICEPGSMLVLDCAHPCCQSVLGRLYGDVVPREDFRALG